MKRVVILLCLMVYVGVWWQSRNEPPWADQYLSAPMPAHLLKIASGYGQHMVGFGLFVKTSVFAGNNRLVGIDKHASGMAQNFEAAAQLYPEFTDIYYFAQSFLPHVSHEYAQRANAILALGVTAHPDQLFFPFFQGFNYFRYLDDPLAAAEIFADLAQRPDAPSLFGSLSSELKARGGRLSAGRDMLLVMYESEPNEVVRERYALEIANFDRALAVQAALNRYRENTGEDAEELAGLVPDYLIALPGLELGYILQWEPPVLKLIHPAVKLKRQ